MIFCCLPIFLKLTFAKKSFRNIVRVSNSRDPDQAQLNVGHDLAPNCLQNLSAEELACKELKN